MTDSAHLDKVAEAMWHDQNGDPFSTADSRERGHYLRMAQAAIDALGAMQQWGHAIALDGRALDVNANVFYSLSDARKHLVAMNGVFPDDRRVVVTRWGPSRWVRVDGGDQ